MRLLEEGPKSLSQSMGLDPELCLYSGIHLDIRLQTPSPELGSPRRGGVCKLGSSYAGSGSRISILDKNSQKHSADFTSLRQRPEPAQASNIEVERVRGRRTPRRAVQSDYWSTHLSSGTTTMAPHAEFINTFCDGST